MGDYEVLLIHGFTPQINTVNTPFHETQLADQAVARSSLWQSRKIWRESKKPDKFCQVSYEGLTSLFGHSTICLGPYSFNGWN